MDIVIIRAKLKEVVEHTGKIDFKFLSSYEKKKTQLAQIKNQFDGQIDDILGGAGIDGGNLLLSRHSLWKAADTESRAEFGALDEKEMLNGFYLQEVMSRYVNKQVDYIIEHLEN